MDHLEKFGIYEMCLKNNWYLNAYKSLKLNQSNNVMDNTKCLIAFNPSYNYIK